MSKTIFAIGGNSVLAQTVLPVLGSTNDIITGGRKDCDVYCDVTKDVVVPSQTDVVINFAASFGGTSNKEIQDAVETNAIGMLRVCEAANTAGVEHVIGISSVFALLSNYDPQHTIYALTKRHADELADFYCKANELKLTILRPSRLYGDNEAFSRGQPFLYKLIERARMGDDIELFGSNETQRNYIHASDIAEILNRVVADSVVGLYTCAQPTNITLSSVASAAQKVFNKGGTITHLEDKPDVPSDNYPLDTSLYEKINYWPLVSIEAGIERMQR